MRFRTKLACLLALSLAACGGGGDGDGNGIEPFDFAEPGLEFPVGESRVLLREWKMESGVHSSTLFSLGVFEIIKDTAVNGHRGLIVASEHFELLKDSIMTYRERALLLQEGKSLNLYAFRSDGHSGFLFGLLKRAQPDTAAVSDTVAFSDGMTQLIFPLVPGGKWLIRPETNPWQGWPLEKEVLGLDTLEFGGRQYQCARLALHSLEVDLKSWVSRIGLLKAEIDYGSTVLTDSAGNILDTAVHHERYRLLKLNPSQGDLDSLKRHYQALYRNDFTAL